MKIFRSEVQCKEYLFDTSWHCDKEPTKKINIPKEDPMEYNLTCSISREKKL